jgi:hypothetical protein
MELLDRTHATDLAQAVRGAAEAAATQATQVAHKAGDRASDLLDPIVEPLLKKRRRNAGGVVGAVRRHPWAVLATLLALLGIAYVAMRDGARAGLDIDDVAADADASNRFRSAA